MKYPTYNFGSDELRVIGYLILSHFPNLNHGQSDAIAKCMSVTIEWKVQVCDRLPGCYLLVKVSNNNCSSEMRWYLNIRSYFRLCSQAPDQHKVHMWTGGKLSGRRRYQLLSADHGKPFGKPQLHIGLEVKCVLQMGRYNFIGTKVSIGSSIWCCNIMVVLFLFIYFFWQNWRTLHCQREIPIYWRQIFVIVS